MAAAGIHACCWWPNTNGYTGQDGLSTGHVGWSTQCDDPRIGYKCGIASGSGILFLHYNAFVFVWFTFALIGPSKGINSGKCQRHGRHPATTKTIHHSTSSSSSTTEDTTATATQSRSTCSNSDLRNYQRKRSECPPAARYCRRHSSIGSTCCKWQRIWNQWNCCR